MEFKEKLKIYSSFAEKAVCSYLPEADEMRRTIIESSDYSVVNGGKRLRPIMMMLSYQLIKGKTDELPGEADMEVLGPFMAALEMIHSSSLVHDDLPCMDNDVLRRGKPSTWAKYGEDMGTLAGDALLLYAFETAAKSKAKPSLSINAMKVLAEKSGIYGMVGGQTLDVELTGKKPSKEQLVFIYENKTGALIEAAFMIGAILAGAGKRQVESLRKAALCIGMAFQIRDDILDVTSTEEELGKPIGSDSVSGKITWLTVFGMSRSEKDVLKYTERAVKTVEKLGGHDFFEELLKYLTERNN